MMRALRAAIAPSGYEGALQPPAIGFGAPTRPQAKRIFWRPLKRIIPPRWIADVSESEMRIELITGWVLNVLGMDAPERVEGVPWCGFVLDEYANMRPEAWTEHVRPALADRKGWAWHIGVPQGRNHYYNLYADYQLRDDCVAFTWKSGDILPASEIAQLQQDLDPRTFRQEMEASFEEAEGRIYYAFDRTHDVHEFAVPANIGTEARPWIGGMDFNVDPMCAVWGWEEERDGVTHAYVWDEIKMRTANTYEAGSRIMEKCEETARFGEFLMHPDPSGKARKTSAAAGKTDHTILHDLGFRTRARSTAPARRDRYNAVNAMFLNGAGQRRVHVHPRCKNLTLSLEGLLYKSDSSEPDLQKCRDMDHACDALGYWLEKRHAITYGSQSFGLSDMRA